MVTKEPHCFQTIIGAVKSGKLKKAEPALVVSNRRDLEPMVSDCNVLVVVTPHRAVDWQLVYARAKLVVDTTNSSSGLARAARQVLRLGAGWNPAPNVDHPQT